MKTKVANMLVNVEFLRDAISDYLDLYMASDRDNIAQARAMEVLDNYIDTLLKVHREQVLLAAGVSYSTDSVDNDDSDG